MRVVYDFLRLMLLTRKPVPEKSLPVYELQRHTPGDILYRLSSLTQTSEYAVNDRLPSHHLIRLGPPKQSVVVYDLCLLQCCLGQ